MAFSPPSRGMQQLQEAVSFDGVDIFNNLLQQDRGTRQGFDRELIPVMFTAIEKDNAAIVEILLNYDMRVSHPFIKAATSANAKKVMGVFIQHGWDINTPSSSTEPPAFVYGLGNLDMALWLLDHGADLNTQSYIDFTPMSYAVQYSPPTLVEELLRRGGDVKKGELLHYALSRTSDVIQVLTTLLEYGAPLNATKYGNHSASRGMFHFMELGTPLHKATTGGNLEAVRLLLAYGADGTIKDNKGRTPEDYAVEAGRSDIVRILRSET